MIVPGIVTIKRRLSIICWGHLPRKWRTTIHWVLPCSENSYQQMTYDICIVAYIHIKQVERVIFFICTRKFLVWLWFAVALIVMIITSSCFFYTFLSNIKQVSLQTKVFLCFVGSFWMDTWWMNELWVFSIAVYNHRWMKNKHFLLFFGGNRK